MKKVLVTGANGFIGKNLISTLKQITEIEILEVERKTPKELIEKYILEADFIYHLAGVNRPKNEIDFYKGNLGFTDLLLNMLMENNKKTPILITSSIQADLDNDYGKSKKLAEEALLEYSIKAKTKVFIYRLPNVFGKWCKPNYNSAIATFCNNIANGENIWIKDENIELTLVYIDDVIKCLVDNLQFEDKNSGYMSVNTEHKATLGHIVNLLKSFKESRKTLSIPNMNDDFTKKLYSTYLSYLPKNEFSYPLLMHEDNRGSFTEFIKSPEMGQVSVNISKPGIAKGNHWHHTKNEKFLVVSGEGIIRFRKIDESEIIEYKVNGEKLEVVDIPIGYTHDIVNTGDIDMVTIMWCNERYNPEVPDTMPLEV
ncbi:MAG: NAD-dependent epimerase/dehydratase family protein [Sarcina sp.]